MNTPTPLLVQLEDVTKVFYAEQVETHALSEVDLEIQSGEYVTVAGPSGSGKSTLLSILGLLDSPTRGRHLLKGKPVEALDADARARIRNSRDRVHFPKLQPDRRFGRCSTTSSCH